MATTEPERLTRVMLACCPKCGSLKTTYGDTTYDCGSRMEYGTCGNCHTTWTETYCLCNVTIDEGE